ncbi:cytidylyltransferase family-domain-containing protein [Lipomyces japonicus]|uniref:cytidylyltransferase family-domain-containing protein n=1 Tax=Lipomyces japonicus TaxID=56871 RepID=UPI0034CEA354
MPKKSDNSVSERESISSSRRSNLQSNGNIKRTNSHSTPSEANRKISSKKKVQEILTPRSRSPLGLIPSHKNYRYFIHKYEVPRKFLHVSIGFLTLALYYRGIELKQVTPVLVFLLVSIVLLDILRFKFPGFSKYYIKAFGFLMRESEVNKWNGIVFYLLGLIIVFLIFPKDISVLSVLLLSWSDTTASTFGRAYGHLTPKFFRNKSLAGSFAAFLTGLLAAYLLYGLIFPSTSELIKNVELAWTPESSRLSLAGVSLISGLIGSAAEAVDVWGLDDNLTIPVISAVVLYSTYAVFAK